MGTPNRESSVAMRLCVSVLIVGAGALALWMAANLSATNAAQPQAANEKSAANVPESETPKYTADGKLIRFPAEVYREWIFVGTPVTPNDLNGGDASFPEFHNVYINPSAWREWKKTGKYPDGTVLIKELTTVGAKQAPSGNGYFEGEFRGLEHAVKDSKRFPAEAKGWGYFTFGHKYPLAKEAELKPVSSCGHCHVATAADDMVFTQYYPVLRAAKGK